MCKRLVKLAAKRKKLDKELGINDVPEKNEETSETEQ